MRRLTVEGRGGGVGPASSSRQSDAFQKWLLGQLRARHMSQRQLAQRSGVDHSSISRLVRGDRMPSLRTAVKLARGIDPTDPIPAGFDASAMRATSPAARVEYALRADDLLSAADVREIMLYYLATRRGRQGQTAAEARDSARSRKE